MEDLKKLDEMVGADNINDMEDIIDLDDMEEYSSYVKTMIDKMDTASTEEEKNFHLIQLVSYLVKSSDKIAEKHDFYEAAGRLYSVAFFLERYSPESAIELYERVISYYIKHLDILLRNGKIQEGANLSLKIAKIYSEKINNPLKESKYIEKSIGLISNQIELLHSASTPQELAGKYQTLAMLYGKISDYEKLIVMAQTAMEYAKLVSDYSIISNSIKEISHSYYQLEQFQKSQNILYEGMDYFSKEAVKYEDKGELLPLSEIYQIIKNIYGILRITDKVTQYITKEAGIYISMAKLNQLYHPNPEQTALYYRAAALCFGETGKNELDEASCYLLSANYYHKLGKNAEASLNYEDAAKRLEKLKNFVKAYDSYIKAGNDAIKANNLQIGIENFMWAYDLAEKHDFSVKRKKNLLNLLIINLKKLAKIEESGENYFVSATLLIESIHYRMELSPIDQNIFDELNHILKLYVKSAKKGKQNGFLANKSKHFAYTYMIIIVLSKLLSNEKTLKSSMEKLHEINSENRKKNKEINLNIGYYVMAKIFTQKDDFSFGFSAIEKDCASLLEKSEEIKIIGEIFKAIIQNSDILTK